MTKWIITYHRHPDPDVVVEFFAESYEDAVIFAKQYRRDSFSVDKA